MTKRYLWPSALIVLFLVGCANRIDVQHYPFGSPIHHAHNGIEFIDMGLNEDAMREFKTALVENPYFSPALAGKGIYWALAGVPDVSRAYIALAKRYASTPEEKTFSLLASMRVSFILEGDEWFTSVSRDFDEIAATSPNNDEALYWMGVSLLKIGNSLEAEKKLRRVVDLDGKYTRDAQQRLKEITFSAPNP